MTIRPRLRPLRLRSLGNKLALLFFAITALAFLAVFLYVVPQLESNLRSQRRNDLTTMAHAASAPLRAAEGTSISAKRLDELVRAVADAANAQVTLLGVQRSSGGRARNVWVISDSRAQSKVPRNLGIALRAARTRRQRSGYATVLGQHVVRSAVPLVFQGQADWVALYSRPLSGVSETVGLVRTRLLIATGIAVLVALLGGYLVAGLLARRVRRLERAAREVAAGRFIEPLPVDSEDELGELTRTFNEMQRQLARVDRARKEFVANASHELRTPIFSLRGFLELLEEEGDEASRAEMLGTMRAQIDRLRKLTRDLLDLSRLDAGSMELSDERVDLGELAQSVAHEFRPAVSAGDAHLDLRLSSRKVVAHCDRERAAQIMRILLDNAIRHTPAGTHVTLRARARNGIAELVVADDGPGLEPEDAAHVFERFYTADSSGGAGLGLAIARELAERMSGDIGVRTRPGETVFTVTLPAGWDARA